jgi:hypothetical protein
MGPIYNAFGQKDFPMIDTLAGAMTLSIMTLAIMTFSIMTLSIMTFSIRINKSLRLA